MLNLFINYKDRSHKVQIQNTKTVGDVKKSLVQLTRIPSMQQELSSTINGLKHVYSDDNMPLNLTNMTSDTIINLKNLGPQIKWEYVFYLEYAGPLIIFPILYLLGDQQNYNQIQVIALIMTIIHYVKRELQTAFVHVFSRNSMPMKRVFINSMHYWIFFALSVGIQLFFFPDDHTYPVPILFILCGLWTVFEFLNYLCHTVLSSFRKKKQKTDGQYQNESKNRGIPRGYGFNLVSCANYLWQVLGWITFSILTRCYTSYLFSFYSFYQMLEWAIKKHKNYKKEFGDKYPKGRKAMIPFIV